MVDRAENWLVRDQWLRLRPKSAAVDVAEDGVAVALFFVQI
jgi:hypothetical protein